MTISERIIKVRRDEGLSQVEFAKKLNLSKQTVSNYETGARQPGLDIILKISDEFNISTDYLLEKSDYKTPEANKLSALTSQILDTSTINKLGSFPVPVLKSLNKVFLSGGLDSLIYAINRYQSISEEELNEYGRLIYGNDSGALKMIKLFDKEYLKKKMLHTLLDNSMSILLEELDYLGSLSLEEDEE